MTEGKRAILILSIVLVALILVLGYRQRCFRQSEELRPILRTAGSRAIDDFKRASLLLEKGSLDESLSIFQRIADTSRESDLLAKSWWLMADIYQRQGKLEAAREACKTVVYQFSSSELVADAQKKLEELNMKILFSPLLTEDSFLYKVQPGDSLFALAGKFGTTVGLIKRANDLKNDKIIVGDQLKISTVEFSVVINRSRNSLTLKSGEEVLKTYPVSTGKDDLTPTGVFRVENKVVDPPWYREGEIIPAGSPENILGTRWIGFSEEGYGIHGTTDPENIGYSCTEGCIRMRNENVEELFAVLPLKAEVVIIE